MSDWWTASPHAVREAAVSVGAKTLLRELILEARGHREVGRVQQPEWARRLGCSVRQVGRYFRELHANGLVLTRWSPHGNIVTLTWVRAPVMADMNPATSGSATPCDGIGVPRQTPPKQNKLSSQGEGEEVEEHDGRLRLPQIDTEEPRTPGQRMADSPVALARYFESQVRAREPGLEWKPNAPALAAHFRRRLDDGVPPGMIRGMIELFALRDLAADSAYDVMKHWQPLPRDHPACAPEAGGAARAGYDARTELDWPWRFFLAASARLEQRCRERSGALARDRDPAAWYARDRQPGGPMTDEEKRAWLGLPSAE